MAGDYHVPVLQVLFTFMPKVIRVVGTFVIELKREAISWQEMASEEI